MSRIDALRDLMPEEAKDTRLNLQSVLDSGSLSERQTWGVAAACAVATRNPRVREAILAEAGERLEESALSDALAAASLMAMNNVYYRFRHMIGKEGYSKKPARLRMNRIGKPAGDRTEFELFCLAVSAINGCEMCLRSHEKVVLDGGLTEEQVHDAVRIAAVLQASAVALEAAEVAAPAV